MRKKAIDLTATELGNLASDAWKAAAERAFAAGLPVTGSRDGRRIRYYPNGRIEDLGPVADAPRDDGIPLPKKPGRSVV
jgi:hypothetical protein